MKSGFGILNWITSRSLTLKQPVLNCHAGEMTHKTKLGYNTAKSSSGVRVASSERRKKNGKPLAENRNFLEQFINILQAVFFFCTSIALFGFLYNYYLYGYPVIDRKLVIWEFFFVKRRSRGDRCGWSWRSMIEHWILSSNVCDDLKSEWRRWKVMMFFSLIQGSCIAVSVLVTVSCY